MIYYEDDAIIAGLTSPVRKISMYVWLYSNGEYLGVLGDSMVKEITVERVGEDSKFFGYGVCHRLNLKLIDIYRAITLSTSESFQIIYTFDGAPSNYYFTPILDITETHRDEKTGELSITAYDKLYTKAARHIVSDLNLESYTMAEFATACANLIGAEGVKTVNFNFDTSYTYTNGASFNGDETIREALTALAEATQSIYYIDYSNTLVFKRLSNEDDTAMLIRKEDYIELDTNDNRRLSTIAHITELGDNIAATTELTGTTQYIRNNPFWEAREDVADLVQAAIDNIGDLTINQFECSWRGNPNLEIGDRIMLQHKNGGIISTFLLNDTIHFNGVLSQETQWQYEPDETESEVNSTSIGEVIKKTFARVDKANQQIELVVSKVDDNTEKISSIQQNTDAISLSVKDIQDNVDAVNGSLETITKQVETIITPEEMQIAIKNELDNGVEKVITQTGFTFDEVGLTVSKTDKEMKTTITEDGMIVYKNDEAVLTANNIGVDAVNLHATTYLIIGNNSRFEDYGSDRTGCFWIGG